MGAVARHGRRPADGRAHGALPACFHGSALVLSVDSRPGSIFVRPGRRCGGDSGCSKAGSMLCPASESSGRALCGWVPCPEHQGDLSVPRACLGRPLRVAQGSVLAQCARRLAATGSASADTAPTFTAGLCAYMPTSLA